MSERTYGPTRARSLLAGALGFFGAVGLALWAQDGPGPEPSPGASPGGSDFATQFNDGGTFGGVGPGMAGEVLTSNGAGMAPSFQAGGGGGGCDPMGAANEVLLDDGAGGCDTVSGLGSAGEVLTSNGAGMAPTWQAGGGGVAQTTGTFTATYQTACTVNATQDFAYVLTGNLVTIRATTSSNAGAVCTSDSTSFVGTSADIPAPIRPAVNLALPGGNAQDNGANVATCLILNAAGTIGWGVYTTTGTSAGVCQSTGWTNTGNKLAYGAVAVSRPGVFSYMLN